MNKMKKVYVWGDKDHSGGRPFICYASCDGLSSGIGHPNHVSKAVMELVRDGYRLVLGRWQPRTTDLCEEAV